MEIGKAIEQLREDRHIKPAALAKSIGMSKSAVCRYESGEITPSLEALVKIAGALDVKVCEIVARAEGVNISVREETDHQRDGRLLMESLDEQTRYKLAAIAAIIKDGK